MNVLVCHNYYQQPGGEQSAVDSLIALLKRRGHRVTRLTEDSSVIRTYRFKSKIGFLWNTVYSLRTVREIQKIIRRERPDVAHVHNVFPLISPSVYRALERGGVPVVQTVHNFRLLCPNGLFYTHGGTCELCKYGNTIHAVRHRCYRGSYVMSALYAFAVGLHRLAGTFDAISRFIVLSEFAGRKLVESRLASAGKVVRLGNFVDESLLALRPLDSREPYFVYVGRLSDEKGIMTLVQAAASSPSLHIKILGGGPLAEPLNELIRERNLGNVQLLGYVTGQAKLDVLGRALACVIPSTCYENFPLALVESLSLGTPVIASDIGSLPDLIEHGRSGLLFKVGSHDDLRAKMNYLLNSPTSASQMGRYGRLVVETKYTPSAYYNALMAIYQGL